MRRPVERSLAQTHIIRYHAHLPRPCPGACWTSVRGIRYRLPHAMREAAGSLRAGSESEVVTHARHAEGLKALEPCAERAAGLESLHWREGHARTERERGELRADESISVEAF